VHSVAFGWILRTGYNHTYNPGGSFLKEMYIFTAYILTRSPLLIVLVLCFIIVLDYAYSNHTAFESYPPYTVTERLVIMQRATLLLTKSYESREILVNVDH
jgi:hypothetical protein